MAWILMGFIVLLALLFSGVKGVALFGAGVIWLLLNASGIFVCMWIKIRVSMKIKDMFEYIRLTTFSSERRQD